MHLQDFPLHSNRLTFMTGKTLLKDSLAFYIQAVLLELSHVTCVSQQDMVSLAPRFTVVLTSWLGKWWHSPNGTSRVNWGRNDRHMTSQKLRMKNSWNRSVMAIGMWKKIIAHHYTPNNPKECNSSHPIHFRPWKAWLFRHFYYNCSSVKTYRCPVSNKK